MAIVLNQAGFDHARELITNGEVVRDQRAGWSKPPAAEENAFIAANGMQAFGDWHLGIDDQKPPDAKARYEFPFGDLHVVRLSALLAAEGRAGEYKHADIESAAKRLIALLKE